MIDFNEEDTGGLDFYEKNTKITPENARLRAEKISYAMAERSPGQPEIQSQVLLGREDQLRAGFAASKEAELASEQLTLFKDIAASNDRGAEAVEIASGLTQNVSVDPGTVVEKQYADRLISDLYFTPALDKSMIDLSLGVKPLETNALLDIATNEVAKAEVVKKIFEDLDLEYTQSSSLRKVTDVVEQFVPFYTWYNIADDFELMGTNLKEQVRELHKLPLPEFQKEVQRRTEEIAAENLNDAYTFLSAVYSYSDTEALWGNIQSGMDVADVLPLTLLSKALRGTVRGLKLQKGVNAAEALASVGKTGDAIAARALQIAQKEKLFFEQIDGLMARDPTQGMKQLVESVPSFADPFAFFTGHSFREGARELADRILPKALDLATTAVRSLGDRTNIARLGEAAVKAAVDVGIRQARKEFTHLNDAIIDIRHVPSEASPVTNIDSIGIHFGKPSGELFETPEQAEYFAKVEYKLPDYQIEMQGEGAYISVFRDLDETTDTVRDLIIQTGNTTPELNLISGYLRSASDLLPTDIVEANKVLVHGIQESFESLRTLAEPIINLPKKSKGNFERFLTDARDFVNWEGKNYTRGRQFNTLPEFEEQWVNSFGVLPTDAEALAYFSYVKLGEWDYFLRNLSVYQAKARLGLRTFSLKGINDVPEGKAFTMKDVLSRGVRNSQEFEGKIVDNIDFSVKDDAGILLWDPDYGKTVFVKRSDVSSGEPPVPEGMTRVYHGADPGGDPTTDTTQFGRDVTHYRDYAENFRSVDGSKKDVYYIDVPKTEEFGWWDPDNTGMVVKKNVKLGPEYNSKFKKLGAKEEGVLTKADIDELTKGPYVIIQVASPYSLPLKADVKVNDIINYIITPAYDSKRLSYQQIPFRPGGHVAYDYPFFVKQGRAMWAGDRRVYTGDVTIRPANTEKDAREYTHRLETARKLLKDKRESEFADYVNNNLPEDAANLKQRFDNGTLSLDEPIAYVRKGSRTLDLDSVKKHFGNIEEAYRDPLNLLRDVNKEFAGERGVNVSGVIEEGTEFNPMFQLQAPRLVDPLTIANRAAANLARNGYLEDYRRLAAEHFVEEFGDSDVLKYPKEYLRNNPVAFLFQKDIFNEKTLNRGKMNAARNFQRSFINLMGVPTPLQREWMGMKAKIYDQVYSNVPERTADLGNDMLIGRINDPVTFSRKAAFELKMGMFNPVQLWKQAQTMAIAMAISPKHAIPSSFGAVLMRFMAKTANKDILNWYAKKASYFGWTKEDFLEAYDHLQRSGLLRVEGEHSWSDDMLDPGIYTTSVGKILDKGKVFFREGERITRLTGFNTAYREWKAANPGKAFDRKAFQAVMRRQDDLTVNMTRASNAHWQNAAGGILSVPTQFYTYQTRLMELMLGKRLSSGEKARVLLAYSALYGVPVGVSGTALGVWPWYEDIRQGMLERGLDFPNTAVEVLHKGIVSTMLHLATGKEYNWGEAYGPSGISLFKDILSSESFLEIVLGASGSTMSELVKTSMPVIDSLSAVIREPSNGGLEVLAEDFIDFTRNISSVNNAAKLFYAVNQAKYISKRENYLTDPSALDGVFMGIFGFSPQDVDDISAIMESNKERKAAVDSAKKEMVKYLRRWVEETDPETQTSYLHRVKEMMISADIPPGDFPKILSEAMEGKYQSLFQSLQWNFFIKNAPPSQAKDRLEHYLKRNQ